MIFLKVAVLMWNRRNILCWMLFRLQSWRVFGLGSVDQVCPMFSTERNEKRMDSFSVVVGNENMNHVAVKSVGCYSCLLCCVRCRWVWSFCAGYLLTFLLSLGLSCWWCCAACVRSGSSSWYPRWGRWCGRFSKDSRRFFWLAPVCIFHLCVAECVIFFF